MKLKEKEISKNDMKKKMEAWKTLNEVLVQTNAQFINSLHRILAKEEEKLNSLEEKLKLENATDKDNAEYIYTGGYVQCLRDILNIKATSDNA